MSKIRQSSFLTPLTYRTWINIISVLTLFLSLIYYIYYIKSVPITGFDDAYMFIRYATNFLDGFGFSWNRDGIQTYGTTSLLYLILIIIFRGALPGINNSTILILTSAVLGLLSIMVMAHTCARFSRSKYLANAQIPIAAILMILLAFSPLFRFHLVSGMDTTLSLFLNSCLLYATFQWLYSDSKHAFALTIIAGYLSYLARPDNLVSALLFPPCCALILPTNDRKQMWLHYLLGFLVILVGDSIVKQVIFGDPLPLPFYAKASGYYEGYSGAYKWNPIPYLFDFGTLVLPFLIVGCLFILRGSVKFLIAFAIPSIVTFTYYFSVVQIMGIQARFYFPALPFFVVCGFFVLDYFFEMHKRNEIKGLLTGKYIRHRILIVFMMIITIPQPAVKIVAGEIYRELFLVSQETYSSATNYVTLSRQFPPILGWWQSIQAVSKMAMNLPNNTRFALSEYGFVGAKAPSIHIIDPLGLNDPFFAHNGFTQGEFFSRKPDLIWFPHSDYTKIVSSILDSGEFWQDYEFYPGAFDYGLAIRKNSQNYQLVHDVVEKSWWETYEILEMDKYMAKLVSNK